MLTMRHSTHAFVFQFFACSCTLCSVIATTWSRYTAHTPRAFGARAAAAPDSGSAASREGPSSGTASARTFGAAAPDGGAWWKTSGSAVLSSAPPAAKAMRSRALCT